MESLPIEIDSLLAKTSLLLKQIFGTNAEIAAHSLLVRKHDYIVMRAEMRQPAVDLILKLAGPEAPFACPFEQSAMIHQLVARQTSIVMPEVFAADSSYQHWPWRYLVRANMPGVEWAQVRDQLSEEEVAELHTQLGDAVAQIHNIRLPAFGEFTANGEVGDGKNYLEALRARSASTIKNGELRACFLSLLEQNTDLFAEIEDAALCHEDLHRHNILLRKESGRWHLATILDFDKAWAGCPESDLARLELWDGMTSEDFWRGYHSRREVTPLYASRRPIYQFLWCLEYAMQTARHLADTNRLCETLGLPRIEHFG